ncbi:MULTISPECIES: hypothetical protein [Mycobacterium avium complex (MAC)]|nr:MULTISPECIES: hypothetical protein [Mycobacterium avium complex (MAC)]KDO99498.1 hypothetical protein MAV3388_10875 [Mycobacterium avium subsp. hominissuis 3388]
MISGGDNKHPRHVIGAVTVLGQGFGEPRVHQCATTVGQPQQVIENRRR